MSIPPLVCSTPPPPEQCEDDKDQEDFDLNYHLSREEDENNEYDDYGDFSNYNHFKSTSSKTCQELDMSQDVNKDVICSNTSVEKTEIGRTNINKTISVVVEDDVLEDLNLKINEDSAGNTQKHPPEESETNVTEKDLKTKGSERDIPNDISVCRQTLEQENDAEIDNIESPGFSTTVNLDENTLSPSDELCTEQSSDHTDSPVCSINALNDIVESNTTDEIGETVNDLKNLEENAIEKKSDLDEFEDFEGFQFVSSDSKPAEIVLDTAADNPWEDTVPKSDDFGDFTANFEDSPNQTPAELNKNHDEQEDDFGDFDEFKSVNESSATNLSPECGDEVSVLNFHSSESEYQIIERINKVIYTVFQDEIEECPDELDDKLETLLGETWSYLRETDIRQPYIVNWNNSLSQKTLLKALCIDSRNILFGPKWSSSMPKYAANLSMAPLQPQKQSGQSSVAQSEVSSSEKTTNKTWSDPFTADGQEFTYAEALLLDLEHLMATLDQMAHNHSTLKISELLSNACHADRENTVIETGPTDLDVFEAATSTKSDKIYSNTISIQPIRQINLPDTHIFTPTNSEIPRSKTIHYDNMPTPTVLLPQSVTESTSAQSVRTDNDNDYWEFQDFRGFQDSKSISDDKVLSQPTVNEETKDENHVPLKQSPTLATQVLQPIKLEPIMPTLNWPDPGEVKETFEDFSDFMSNIPGSEKQETMPQHVSNNDSQDNDPPKIDMNRKKSITDDKLDDEFDMFQSALPSIKNTSEYNNAGTEPNNQSPSSQPMTSKMTDFDIVFSKIDNPKSENISQTTKPTENVVNNVENATNILKPHPVSSNVAQMSNSHILQPSLATSSNAKQSQQKVSQILQPLSLESYSQINWPNPGIDLQDLSRFNPVETLHSLKNDSNSQSKTASPIHNQKSLTNNNQTSDEDIWGEFVSSKPKQQQVMPKKQSTFVDDDEWTDFVSSPSVNPQNGLNTISLNVHTSSNMQKSSNSTKYQLKSNDISLDIPALNYITPKGSKSFNDRHFQNL